MTEHEQIGVLGRLQQHLRGDADDCVDCDGHPGEKVRVRGNDLVHPPSGVGLHLRDNPAEGGGKPTP